MATSLELSNSQLDEDSGTDMSDLDVDGLGESGPRKKMEKAKWTENEVIEIIYDALLCINNTIL